MVVNCMIKGSVKFTQFHTVNTKHFFVTIFIIKKVYYFIAEVTCGTYMRFPTTTSPMISRKYYVQTWVML